MAKFLLDWELDSSKTPVNPKERAEGWSMLMKAVQQDLRNGVIKEWGAFAGESKGYCVMEGSAAEVHTLVQKFVPFVQFESHPLVSADEVDVLIQKMKDA
jgi:hypothetical protein